MSAQSIVERLRELAVEWHEMCGDIHEPLTEAADTIEELLEALERIRFGHMEAWDDEGAKFTVPMTIEEAQSIAFQAIAKAKASPISGEGGL